jgi:Flp pilus assembly protein TadD
MPDRSSRRRVSAFTRGAQLTLIVALLACTAALGGALPAALWVLVPLSALALALAALAAGREGVSLRLTGMGVVLLAACGLVALQLIPLPHGLHAWLSPAAADLRGFVLEPLGIHGWRPLTLDAPSTWRALGAHLAYAAVFIAATHVSRHRDARRQLLAGVAGVGALVAGIAVLHLLVDARSLFGVYRFQEAGPPLFTPFGNPNHLAGFLTLTALFALGLALTAKERGASILWGVAFVAQGACVLLSFSRGGIAFFAVAVLLLCALLLRQRGLGPPAEGKAPTAPRSPLWRVLAAPGFVWVLAALTAVGSVGAYLAWDQLVMEMRTVDSLEKIRQSKVDLWPMLAGSAAEYPWAGMGRGAFELAFSRHHTQWAGVVFTHAENLPLHVLAELGLVPGALLLLGALAAFVSALRGRGGDKLDLAVAAGLAGVLLHDLFDFALEMHAPAVAALLALGALCRPAETSAVPRLTRIRLGPVPALLAAALVACVGAFALVAGRHHHLKAEASLLAMVKDRRPAPELLAAARPLIERHPADYYLHGLLAQAYSRGEGADPVNALAFANRALYLRPLDADAHRAAARALLRLGRRSQAMLEYRLAYEAHAPLVLDEIVRAARTVDELHAAVPHTPAAILQLAHQAHAQGRGADASALVDRAREELREHPDAAQLWVVASAWALSAGRADEALKLITEAAALDPRSPAIPRTRADVLARVGQRAQAIDSLEEALRRHVGNFELALALSAHLAADGQRHRARAALTRAAPFVSNNLDRARLLQAEGALLRAEGRNGKALEAFLSAARLQPENAGLHFEVARLYEQLQRPHDAIRAIREGTRLEGRVRPEVAAWTATLEARDRELSELRRQRQVLGRDAIPDELLFGDN